jgi:rhodanese-related sulfurtransferase
MTSTPVQTRSLDVQTLKARLETDDAPRMLDVRTPAEFENAHIPGSYNVPLDTLREHRGELQRHLGEDVVLVCQSGGRATQAEKALAEVGLPGLRVLEGGMAAWQLAGAPVNRGAQTWELERQVRLVAGGLVLSSILGSTVAPNLKWLAGGIGAGLTFAAVSNTCAMGMALAKMPWNKRGGNPDIDQVIRALAEAS